MKQFNKILSFELRNYLKNKIFVGITVFAMIVIAVVMSFPRIMSTFKNDDDKPSDTQAVMLVSVPSENNIDYIKSVFKEAFTSYNVVITSDNVDQIKEKITSGDAECAFVINDAKSYKYYVNNLSMYDSNTQIADDVMVNVYRMQAMLESGIPPEDASAILSVQITHETENLGKDQMQNFFYTYIMIFALYMVILLYGQMVATNVATEKSSRAMELLITSAKPTSMMFGKVIASCLAGLTQLICIFGSAFVFFNLNKTFWDGNMIVNSIFDMPIECLAYMLLFFILGFFIYAFMYGAVGSTASKLEDINTSVMPITLLFIAAFFVVMFSMSSGNIDNTLMQVCSYIPFTSPMAMFTRIVMSTVPLYEIVISIIILIASVFGIGIISAKIYRVGVLLYGTTPKISSILKSIRKE